MTDHRDQGPSPQSTRYPVRIALILAIAAAVLRLAVIVWRRGNDPLFHQPINDASMYDQWARALIAGQGFGLEGAPFFLPPLYPYLTALLYRLDGGTIWAVTHFSGLAGCGNCARHSPPGRKTAWR